MVEAVCVLVERNGRVLGVARRGTADQWGLPGGKVDPGESLREAACREAFEETGAPVELGEKVFVRENKGFVCTTFRGTLLSEPSEGDAGPVKWVTWEDLEQGPFGIYNRRLREAVGA